MRSNVIPIYRCGAGDGHTVGRLNCSRHEELASSSRLWYHLFGQPNRAVHQIAHMISWYGRHNDYIRLDFTAYESPEIAEGYDANWVRIGIEAQNEQGAWARNCSCILTWEIYWLSQWFAKVTDGLVDERLVLLEPDLQFQYLATSESIHRFAIRLSNGLGYPSPTSDNFTSIIVIGMSDIERHQAVTFLKDVATRYPVRGHQGILMLKDLPEIELL